MLPRVSIPAQGSRERWSLRQSVLLAACRVQGFSLVLSGCLAAEQLLALREPANIAGSQRNWTAQETSRKNVSILPKWNLYRLFPPTKMFWLLDFVSQASTTFISKLKQVEIKDNPLPSPGFIPLFGPYLGTHQATLTWEPEALGSLGNWGRDFHPCMKNQPTEN